MNSANLDNGLKLSVDWIAFTVLDESATVQSVIEMLGFEPTMFTSAPRGANGYRSMLNLDGYSLSILYDGKPDMGIHVNISGSAVPHAISTYYETKISDNPFDDESTFTVSDFGETALTCFLKDISNVAKFSRIDIAVDDMCHPVFFTISDIVDSLSAGCFVSKFRHYTNHVCRSISNPDELIGGTIYFGSSSSDVRLRVYDKCLEQNSKHGSGTCSHDWIRWEFQLRNERAISFVRLLEHGIPFSEAVVGIFNNYLRLVINDNTNRTRCTTDPRWVAFLGSLQKIRLTVKQEPKTLQDKRNWIVSQVLPTLTGVIIADGGVFDVITEHWDASIMRMKSDMCSLIGGALRTSEYYGVYASP